ncbi:MAG: Tad domain-containing protein, partial [Bacteroidales bacterium]|nr:Tad domain-containing protein [Bacteroidales bacterium]
MKHYQKTHGAVSVFLVLILVPCLVFTSIFVDLGRSHMSKAMAESSADLALNTLMTNYDGDLNEWYGLIASTQDINKYYDTATQYFLRSMSSQKIEGYETSLISDYAQSAFDTTKVSDLLKCDVQTAPSEIIGPVSGANLSNAALMKVQVIEFMKYRGPIEIIRGVFGRFMGAAESKHNGEDDAPNDGGSVTDAQKNEDDVKYKQEFYKAEGELLAAAFHTYVAIRKYYRDEVSKPYDGSAPFNNSRLKEYTERLDGYRETYRELHGQYVRYFANTGELSIYKHPNFKLTDYQQTDPKKAFEKDPKGLFKSKFKKDKDESGNEIYTITGTTLHDLMDDLKQAIKDFDTARSNLAEKGQELLNTMYGSESDPNAISPIQWWVKMDKAINSSGLSKKAKEAGEKVLILYQAMYLAGSDSGRAVFGKEGQELSEMEQMMVSIIQGVEEAKAEPTQRSQEEDAETDA